MPAQTVLRGDMHQRHRERIQRKVLLQPTCLSLLRLGPGKQLGRVAPTSPALESLRRVLDDNPMLTPRQVGPASPFASLVGRTRNDREANGDAEIGRAHV